MAEMVRKHFILPRALAEEFERVAGERKQSERLAEVLERWLRQPPASDAFDVLAAHPPRAAYPEWDHELALEDWVAAGRSDWERGSRDVRS